MSSLEGANSVRDGRKVLVAIVEEIGSVCLLQHRQDLSLVCRDLESSITDTKDILCINTVTLQESADSAVDDGVPSREDIHTVAFLLHSNSELDEGPRLRLLEELLGVCKFDIASVALG